MDLYITFGQTHTHSINGKTLDKDTIAKIKCKDYTDGRVIAHEFFNGIFAFSYIEDEMKDSIHLYPKGIIEVN